MTEWAIITALALFTAYCIYRQWQEMTGRTKRRLVRMVRRWFDRHTPIKEKNNV